MDILYKNMSPEEDGQQVIQEVGGDFGNFAALSRKGKFEDFSTEFLHYHRYHQLLTIYNGVSLLVDRYAQQPLYGNLAVFIPAGFAHRSTVIGESVTFQSLYFKKELFDYSKEGVTFFEFSELGRALFRRLGFCTNCELDQGLNGDILDLFFKITAEDSQNGRTTVILPRHTNKKNEVIITFLEKNYSNRLTLADFAEKAGYTGRHISRLFKDDLKISIFEYLKLYRLLMASIFLTNTKETVIDIAFECGYESLSTFYSDFKNYFALTPREFRRKVTG